MKPLLLICILLISACRKESLFDLKNPTILCDSCYDKSVQKSVNEIEYLCPIDSIAFLNTEQWRTYLHKCVTLDSDFVENTPSGKYEVLIKFEISQNGNAINSIIFRDAKFGFGEKGLRIFNSYNGKWNLPTKDEYESKTSYFQPIVFEILDE
ncbi:MAG TPA: hypothetical protein VMY77_17115 [Chitinophagaceae bacterium]|nr:hypothetical protein [Chitinophagaceae bacterium]